MNLEQLHESGYLNDYFYNKAIRNLQYLDDTEAQNFWLQEANEMSNLGINSVEEEKLYWVVTEHMPEILHEIFGKRLARTEDIKKEILKNRHNFDLSNLIGLFDATAISAKNIGIPVEPSILQQVYMRQGMGKMAYPQYSGGTPVAQTYNIARWMQATRDIYARVNNGESFSQAFNELTNRWGKAEKIDFKHWLNFYQEGAHLKYKIARSIPSHEGGYHLPIRYEDVYSHLPRPVVEHKIPDPRERPKEPQNDINDVRERVENQRSKIISRLNAAEKLLSSLDGQLFAGDDQDFMLKLLQDLKRKVQTSNKLTARSSLFEDFIYQTGNYLNDLGKKKAAKFFFKVAQELPLPPPPGGSGDSSGESSGGLSGLMNSAVPGETNAPATSPIASNEPAKQATEEAFREFFSLLETGVVDIDEEDLQNNKTANDDDAFIVVESQMQTFPRRDETPSLETKHRDTERNVSDAIEGALQNVTIQDVIHELEILSGLFKKREIARRLAVIDIMMDRLGIGAFFPSLGESLRSALDSNQYVSTRIEDVLSKLRGSIEHAEADEILEDVEEQVTPETQNVQRNLEQQEQQEEERRDRRRQKEEQKALQPEPEKQQPQAPAPQTQELAGPANVETARPVPVR